MIRFQFQMVGDQAVVSRFEGADARARERLLPAMEKIGTYVEALMRLHAGALGKKSGKLGRSFYHKVTQKGTTVTVTAGVSRRAFYAAFQDRGVDKTKVDVKGYTRRAKGDDVRQGRRKVAYGVGYVAPYKRDIKIRARPFIARTLQDLQDEIQRDIAQAILGVGA